jgi:hypothetical protein
MNTDDRNHFDPQMTSEAFSAPTQIPPTDLAQQHIYRLLIRIDRLEYLIDVDAPSMVVRNEQRLVRSAIRELTRFSASLSRDGESERLDAAICDGALAKLLSPEANIMAAQ